MRSSVVVLESKQANVVFCSSFNVAFDSRNVQLVCERGGEGGPRGGG